MTDLALIVDMEKVASRWLREHPAVVALGARVVGKPPGDRSTCWVQVRELNAPSDPRSQADHLVTHMLQLDCYAGAAGGQPEANLLGRTVRAVLKRMEGFHDDEAAVGGVRIVGFAHVPDPDGFEPARERRIITAMVTAHPVTVRA